MQIKLATMQSHEQAHLLTAMENSLAMIQFQPEGTITWINSIFSKTIGYTPEELINNHHEQLCQKEFTLSDSYEEFWTRLRSGERFQDKIKRVKKDGKIIILEATYIPVKDEIGVVTSIIKIATDITYRENAVNDITTNIVNEANTVLSIAQRGHDKASEIIELTGELIEQSNKNSEILNNLQKSSNEIEGIVNTISEISIRTDILALNAAIEAARAGNEGQGFAVIADEIRTLANNSKRSIQDVEELVYSNKKRSF